MVTALITVAALARSARWRLAAGRSTSLTAPLMRCVRRDASASGVPGRFKPRVVVAVALDEHNRVSDSSSCAA